MRFEKSLLDNIKILETVEHELASAKFELNQLVNLPANSIYSLVDPDDFNAPSTFENRTVEEFEVRALLRNADLNESIYNARVARQEVHKSLLKICIIQYLFYLKKKILKTSLIRELDIGKNYFSHINPRRKKLLTTLLNSYIKFMDSVSSVPESTGPIITTGQIP